MLETTQFVVQYKARKCKYIYAVHNCSFPCKFYTLVCVSNKGNANKQKWWTNHQFESILDYTVCLHSYVYALFMERIFREMGIMFKKMLILWCNCCDVSFIWRKIHICCQFFSLNDKLKDSRTLYTIRTMELVLQWHSTTCLIPSLYVTVSVAM